jgi:hypothetical protein
MTHHRHQTVSCFRTRTTNDEPLADAHNALLPPDAFHLPVGRPVTHKIYRDAAHPSRLVLPFTKRTAVEDR